MDQEELYQPLISYKLSWTWYNILNFFSVVALINNSKQIPTNVPYSQLLGRNFWFLTSILSQLRVFSSARFFQTHLISALFLKLNKPSLSFTSTNTREKIWYYVLQSWWCKFFTLVDMMACKATWSGRTAPTFQKNLQHELQDTMKMKAAYSSET
jgi:hypothetical protein